MRSKFIPVAFAVVFAACIALPAHAQSNHATDPREFTEAERRAYAQSLKEARGLIELAKYDEAIVVLERLNAQRPREPQARFLKGLALADSGKIDAAIVVYQAVLGDFPELPEPHNNLAVLYAQKGEYGLARDELEAAIAAAPDYVVAYENLGDIHARLAAMNYEKAIARDPKNKSAPTKLKLVRELFAPAATAVPAAASAAPPPAAVATPPAALTPPAAVDTLPPAPPAATAPR